MRHPITRRSFLASSASAASLTLANRPFGEQSPASAKPFPELEKLGAVALSEAKNRARVMQTCASDVTECNTQASASPQRGGNAADEVPFVADTNTFGFGVRVIVKVQWGFAAWPLVTAAEIARITREAVVVARANAAAQGEPVQLALVKAYRDRWTSNFSKHPVHDFDE